MKKGGKQVSMLMMKDLRLPCESGIKNALQERLITVARTDSYLCEHADAYLMHKGEKNYRVHAQGFTWCNTSITVAWIN